MVEYSSKNSARFGFSLFVPHGGFECGERGRRAANDVRGELGFENCEQLANNLCRVRC